MEVIWEALRDAIQQVLLCYDVLTAHYLQQTVEGSCAP